MVNQPELIATLNAALAPTHRIIVPRFRDPDAGYLFVAETLPNDRRQDGNIVAMIDTESKNSRMQNEDPRQTR